MTTFLVHRSDNATSAAQAARSFLESRPVEHNLILTLLRERIAHPTPGRYWWVSESGVVRGLAMQSPRSYRATLTPMPLDAVDPLVGAVAAEVPDLPGVSGQATTAAAFAGVWTERRGTGARPAEGQRLYRLDAVRPVDGVPGVLRVAGPAELELLVAWFAAFKADIDDMPAEDGDIRDRLAPVIADGGFWVWEHGGEPVAAAMLSRPIAGASRVSFVYTPDQQRGHGYATALVAGVCTNALDPATPWGRVDACLLYTQLHNATSNAIYRRIGFRAVAEVTAYAFDSP